MLRGIQKNSMIMEVQKSEHFRKGILIRHTKTGKNSSPVYHTADYGDFSPGFMSVGIRKSAIAQQYLVEVLLIALLAFGLSYFTSSAIAGQIGSHLLEQSMQTELESMGDSVVDAAAVDANADTLLQKSLPTENGIQVSIGLDSLIFLYIIGFVIIIVAVSVSSITVMRLKPREILSKMS